jgi:hypothetical protein
MKIVIRESESVAVKSRGVRTAKHAKAGAKRAKKV